MKSKDIKQENQTENTKINENILETYLVELALKGNKINDLPELADSFWIVVESLKINSISELQPNYVQEQKS